MRITVAGAGYVGLSLATLLATQNDVKLVDISADKTEKINNRIVPFKDREIEEFFREKTLSLTATTDAEEGYSDAEIIIVATPTNYDDENNIFDTSSIEQVLDTALPLNENALIVIKSTIPVGYTNYLKEKYKTDRIIFSPEFLREGKALYDNLYPSRIIIGEQSERAQHFAGLLKSAAEKEDVPVLLTGPLEAESIKLFANTYLAVRVAFFNEIDTYASTKGLDPKQIIDGICLDSRIGDYYNNPSFGYGGYCLPKDTKQLKAEYKDVPQEIISAVVKANDTRKRFIAEDILRKNPETVGIYRLLMKQGSDNFRTSAIIDVMKLLAERGTKIIIFEPAYAEKEFEGFAVENDYNSFAEKSDIIIANRMEGALEAVKGKVYTRDIFNQD